MIAKIKPANMKIFKGFSITTLPKNANFRHNMTKTWNKIPAKISDFTVSWKEKQRKYGINILPVERVLNQSVVLEILAATHLNENFTNRRWPEHHRVYYRYDRYSIVYLSELTSSLLQVFRTFKHQTVNIRIPGEVSYEILMSEKDTASVNAMRIGHSLGHYHENRTQSRSMPWE
jgi:hypothetical protein